MRLLGSGLVLGSGCTRTMIVTDFIISMIQLPGSLSCGYTCRTCSSVCRVSCRADLILNCLILENLLAMMRMSEILHILFPLRAGALQANCLADSEAACCASGLWGQE